MICYIFSDTVDNLDQYLNDPAYDLTYHEKLRESIIRLRDDAEYIRFVLDIPYSERHLPEGLLRDQVALNRPKPLNVRKNGGAANDQQYLPTPRIMVARIGKTVATNFCLSRCNHPGQRSDYVRVSERAGIVDEAATIGRVLVE